jgi:hypothetical protein
MATTIKTAMKTNFAKVEAPHTTRRSACTDGTDCTTVC